MKNQTQVVFNFDSTLVGIEGTFELAKHKGIDSAAIAAAKDSILEAQESFHESFMRRFEEYKPSFSDIAWLAEAYFGAIIPEAKQVIDELKQMGCQIHIVSASYRPAILKTARALGIEPFRVYAIDLEFAEDGSYKSFDDDNILTSIEGYKIVLAELAKTGPVVYVADSVRDLKVKEVVDLFVGFGGVVKNSKVKNESPVYLESLLPLPAKIKELQESMEGSDKYIGAANFTSAQTNNNQEVI